MAHGYLVGLFDILGFEQRLVNLGLPEMLARYQSLVDVVNYRQEQIQKVFGDYGFRESPYWTSEGDIFIFTKTYGAYASDSILLWADRSWPEARDIDINQAKERAKDPAKGWAYRPVPCDNFMDVCNEIICCGLEVGLPLRGAVSMGEAVFDKEKNIYLGMPIVEAARLEPRQNFIGASFCQSFVDQTIPRRFFLDFRDHLKEVDPHNWGGGVLDWPRHWRKTRSSDLVSMVRGLNATQKYSIYYENTIRSIEHSLTVADQFESLADISIRAVYDAFSIANDKLCVPARAIRRVPIKKGDE